MPSMTWLNHSSHNRWSQVTIGEQGTYILCGDFNIEPQSPAYQLLQEGELTNKEMIRLKGVDYIRWGPDSPAPSQVLYVIYL